MAASKAEIAEDGELILEEKMRQAIWGELTVQCAKAEGRMPQSQEPRS